MTKREAQKIVRRAQLCRLSHPEGILFECIGAHAEYIDDWGGEAEGEQIYAVSKGWA